MYPVADIGDHSVDLESVIKRYYRKIFGHELNAWHRVKSDWPQKPDLAAFMHWFDAEVHSMLLDLLTGRIGTEPYENSDAVKSL